jgi:hypothetical protein
MTPPMKRPPLAVAAALLVLACSASRADGLADLKSALARLQAQAPLKASLGVKTLERRGQGKDLEEKIGEANLVVEDGARGLQMTIARDTLARMDDESRRQARDSSSRMPTVWALAKLDPAVVPGMASAASSLAHEVDESVFKGERTDTWGGKPARVLSFGVPLTKVPEPQRKYVKEFEGSLDIWIAMDGTPLACAQRAAVKGRVFVVISFQAQDDADSTYGVVGDRLVTLRRETHIVSSGAGERGEQKFVLTLQPQP